MDLQLTGKRAIVTGGSRGIGKAIARTLAAEGVDVALVARGREALEASASELAAASGRKVVAITADTGDNDSVRAMAAAAAEALGGIDILVNSAAQPASQGPAPTWEQIDATAHFWPDMNVKVMGYLRTAQAVAPYMKAGGWGRIVNISGLNARTAGATVGSMRNVAVAAMTKNLADELGPHGINVVVIHPGVTRTEATEGVIARRAAAEGRTPEEVEESMHRLNSVQRLITADDIAYVATMVASPRSIALNGDAIAAGGGIPKAIYY